MESKANTCENTCNCSKRIIEIETSIHGLLDDDYTPIPLFMGEIQPRIPTKNYRKPHQPNNKYKKNASHVCPKDIPSKKNPISPDPSTHMTPTHSPKTPIKILARASTYFPHSNILQTPRHKKKRKIDSSHGRRLSCSSLHLAPKSTCWGR